MVAQPESRCALVFRGFLWMNAVWVRSLFLAIFWFSATAAMQQGGRPPVLPGGPNVAALRGLEPGQWELRERGDDPHGEPRRICVGDPVQLLQPRHSRAACRRFVIDDSARHAVVTYECDGSGSGRTDLRVETPRLVQIDSQGVSSGAPFAVTIEGRRTGDCR